MFLGFYFEYMFSFKDKTNSEIKLIYFCVSAETRVCKKGLIFVERLHGGKKL